MNGYKGNTVETFGDPDHAEADAKDRNGGGLRFVPLKNLPFLELKKPQVTLVMVEGRGAWKAAGRGAGLHWRDSLIYIVKDKKSGELLKVGETGSWETRFGEYLTRAKNEGIEIVIDIWKIENSSKNIRINEFETPLRKTLKSKGHALPWDKSIPGSKP